jgi:signal transduction histidine kinase
MTGEPKASIRVRFSSVFLFVLAVVVVLGSFSAWRLSDYRTYSDELRDRFFRSTQYLGDLNNYTSDLRAVEGTALLTRSPADVAANARQLNTLDGEIAQAQRHYRHVVHDPDEIALDDRFETRWLAYRAVVAQLLDLSSQGKTGAAQQFYLSTSRSAYDRASDTLGQLTALNLAKAATAAQRAEAAFYQTRSLTIAAMAFAVVMVVAGLASMRRSIADPLIALARAMDDLARNELDTTIPGADRSDEIGGMARAVEVFRLNAIDLAVSQRALADHASLLTDRLAEEQRLTQLQRNFLAMASHEFRTPLAIIDGQAQRLISAGERLSPDDLAERAGQIRRAVLRITSVIDHLIEHARLVERGGDALFEPTRVNLTALLREVCGLHRELVPTAHIAEEFGPAPLTLIGDHKLLTHLFSNLVSNGIKYSGTRARLKVSAAALGRDIVVMVEDHGIGIAESERELVFERYFRGRNTAGTIGTGVGLYLVKAVVELHHGQVALDSKLHEGSRFTIRLPRAISNGRVTV